MNNSIHFIVYSHTDFRDVLSVQTDYLNTDNKSLLINSNNLDMADIYQKYRNVYFYDESIPYASRLLVLDERPELPEYVVLIHDNDIVLSMDVAILEEVRNRMVEKNITRVSLQWDHGDNHNEDHINIMSGETVSKREDITSGEMYLLMNTNGGYPYNVNPTMIHLSRTMNVLKNFQHLTYRNIENEQSLKDIVRRQGNCYLMSSLSNFTKCGYYVTLPFFQFLHITHDGHLLPTTAEKQDDSFSEFAANEYVKMLSSGKLKGRGFRESMS